MWSSVYRQTGKAGGAGKQETWMQPAQAAMPDWDLPDRKTATRLKLQRNLWAQPRFSTYVNTGRSETTTALLVGLFIRTVPNRTSHPSEVLRQGLHPLKNLA